jgi:anaerobic selenocysteine-containing dehydrogenase
MAWNSAMNTAETMRMLTDKDEATGEYRIPRIIYSDAFYSEMVAYADLILPDTTYLERWDAISILDRPIGKTDGPADSIRQPILTPDRDVRAFQDVIIDIGAQLGLPAFVTGNGGPRYPAGYKDYLVYHERAPGIGPLAGWRGEDGKSHGKGAPNPDQLQRYIDNGCFWKLDLPEEQHYYKHGRKGTGRCSRPTGCVPGPRRISTRCRSGIRHSRGRGSTPTRFRSMRSPSGQCRCTTPGVRRMPGCGRFLVRTACSSTASPRTAWACRMTTGCM